MLCAKILFEVLFNCLIKLQGKFVKLSYSIVRIFKMQYTPYEMSPKTIFGLYALEILLTLTHSFACCQNSHMKITFMYNIANMLMSSVTPIPC